MVNHGKINKNNSYRVLRKNKAIANDLTLLNLKKFKNEVNEITQGEECGLAFDKFEDFEPGDLIQAYDFKGHKKGKSYK